MPYVQKTLQGGAGAGYTLNLGQSCGRATVLPEVECYVRFDPPASTAPTAPAASPAPGGAGQNTDYIHLAAGERYEIGADVSGKGLVTGSQDPVQYMRIWTVAAGLVRVAGH